MKRTIEEKFSEEFSLADLEVYFPEIPAVLLPKALSSLCRQGFLIVQGKGKQKKWLRLSPSLGS